MPIQEFPRTAFLCLPGTLQMDGCEKQLPYAVLGLSMESWENSSSVSLVEIKGNETII